MQQILADDQLQVKGEQIYERPLLMRHFGVLHHQPSTQLQYMSSTQSYKINLEDSMYHPLVKMVVIPYLRERNILKASHHPLEEKTFGRRAQTEDIRGNFLQGKTFGAHHISVAWC